MLAARLADFFFRVEARNAPPKSIFYFADLAQKLINFADLLKLAVSPSSGYIQWVVTASTRKGELSWRVLAAVVAGNLLLLQGSTMQSLAVGLVRGVVDLPARICFSSCK
jgi:hypothetical protein